MIELKGYNSLEQIFEDQAVSLFKAIQKSTGNKCFIKLYHKGITDDLVKSIERLISKKDQNVPISTPSEILHVEQKIALVWEANQFSLLSEIISQPIKIDLFFQIAKLLIQGLSQIHKQSIIFKELQPINILIDFAKPEIQFIGVYQSSAKGREKEISIISLHEPSFVYCSPELTGRINRSVDGRSDLYSLGIIFFEILTNKVPFEADTSLKLVQLHLTVPPKSIGKIREDIPKALELIINKLLLKSAEERYQSTYGLLADIEKAEKLFHQNETGTIFSLGKHDKIEGFNIPTKIYGSEENKTELVESFNRVCSGGVELFLIKGAEGIGKTSLALELRNVVHQKNGFFASASLEKGQNHTPYYFLTQVIQSIIHQILTQSELDINLWKETFIKVLGNNSQLIIDFAPDLALIIGPQTKAPSIDSKVAQSRVAFLFRKFFQSLLSKGQPLVLFIDNYQWLDLSSLDLIKTLLCDLASRYLMCIISYQEEVPLNAEHLSSFDAIKLSGVRIQESVLKPMQINNLERLLEDTFSSRQDYGDLATIILKKTSGNPFFVKQILQLLYDKHLIYFNIESGEWNWDIKQIENAAFSENVINLMTTKIQDLPSDTIEIMQMASCIGNRFSMETLEIVLGLDHEQLLTKLQPALDAGFIVKVASKQKTSQRKAYIGQKGLIFRFFHNRVYVSIHSLMNEKEKQQRHLQIGRKLHVEFKAKKKSANIFALVNHLNQGVQLITDQKERHELAKLNLIAGTMSKSVGSYDTAWRHFSVGTQLLDEDSWKIDYDLSKELHLRRSECGYYSENIDIAEPIFKKLLTHVKTDRERAEVTNIRLILFIKNGRIKEATEIGTDALRQWFGIKIPPNAAEVTIVSQVKMQEMQSSLDRPNIDNLIFRPEMKDKDLLATMNLISNIIPAAYIANRSLWIILTARMVEMSMQSGLSCYSAFGFMNFAIILCSGFEDFDSGHAMGQLALRLNEKYKDNNLVSRLNFLFGSYINHWKNPAKNNLIYLKKAYQTGIDHDDLFNAGNSISFLLKTWIFIGAPLNTIEKEISNYQDFIEQLDNSDLENVIQASKLILILQNYDNPTDETNITLPDSEEFITRMKASRNSLPLQWYYLISAQLHFHFSKYSEALRLIQLSDNLVAGYSQLAVSEHYFYYSLIITLNYPNFDIEEKKKYWDILKTNVEKLQHLATKCPFNFLARYELIQAQMASISGNSVEALNRYDESIKASKYNGYPQLEGIANEVAAAYFYSKGNKTIARAYLEEARTAYSVWRANAKIKHLEDKYPGLLKSNQYYSTRERTEFTPVKVQQQRFSDFYDLKTFVEAFQEISSELTLEKLVDRVLEIFLEFSGAHKGSFLLESKGKLQVLAIANTARVPMVEPVSIPFEKYKKIAEGIVFYVLRTKKTVALDNATKEGLFIYDPYISEERPKSVLCLPILFRNRLNGILYVENNYTAGAFSKKRVELLEHLTAQISVAIENSISFSALAEVADQLRNEISTEPT